MNEEIDSLFVPHKESEELRNLGFDMLCMKTHQYFESNGERYLCDIYNRNSEITNLEMYCAAPTLSQAFNWFREIYKLAGIIKIGNQEYSYRIYDERTDKEHVVTGTLKFLKNPFNGTYKEAELACLRKLIEIVKNNKHESK